MQKCCSACLCLFMSSATDNEPHAAPPVYSTLNPKPCFHPVLPSAAELRESWVARAEAVFAQCQGHPGALAFLLDTWSEMLEAGAEAEAATATASAASCRLGVQLPRPLLEWLQDKAQAGGGTSLLTLLCCACSCPFACRPRTHSLLSQDNTT
jgi:hypothetical protein